MRTSGVTQEPIHLFDVLSKWDCFFDSRGFCHLGFNRHSSILSNFLGCDGFESLVGGKERPKMFASLGLSRNVSRIQRVWSNFNRAIRLHCDRIPVGFASVGVSSGENGLSEDACGDLEEENLNFNGGDAEKPKKSAYFDE